jgi:hypothetical protein
MFRFLNWRFNLKAYPHQVVTINSAVMTHSDWDHAGGFSPLFKKQNFCFESVFHNGIIERGGDVPLGPLAPDGDQRYLTGVVMDRAELDRITADPSKVKGKKYLKMLADACTGGRVSDMRMLCTEDASLPGYEDSQPLRIRVLGPVPESKEGKRRLRWFKDSGKTKNGHSIILRLEYGSVKILLGGDLNIPAEEYLLGHYSAFDPAACVTPELQDQLVNAARGTFEVDVAKACHHGSADFSELYLRAMNPIATIISSGDDEPYCHPRPDALGAFGKSGRGSRPLIFSTELARSTKENIKHPQQLRDQIRKLIESKKDAETAEQRKARQAKIAKCLTQLERSVAVYGMINLRTDGTRILLAQKLEQPATGGNRWDIHLLEPDANGRLQYVSQY